MHAKRGSHISVINKLGFLSLLSSFAIAMIATIWSVYIYSFVQNDSYVGFITSFFTIVGILSFIFLIPIIERCNKANLYGISILIYIIIYLLFAFFPSLHILLILGIILAITGSLRTTLFGIIVRDKTKDNKVSENEGIIYTLANISWLFGPVLAGFLLSGFGIKGVFLGAAGIFFMTSVLFRKFKIQDARKTKKTDKKIIKNFINFFKNKQRVNAYILSGGVNFWWCLIYIYIPLYIIQSGLSEKIIGYFLAMVVIPLILSEYYFGKKACKKGFKKIFTTGYLILGISALIIFFISNIYYALGILALASFGMAMLESTTEAYFFDVIKPNQRDKFYGPYNTSIEINTFLGSAIPAAILLFFPFKAIFIFFGISMLIFAIISSKTKNAIENRR